MPSLPYLRRHAIRLPARIAAKRGEVKPSNKAKVRQWRKRAQHYATATVWAVVRGNTVVTVYPYDESDLGSLCTWVLTGRWV